MKRRLFNLAAAVSLGMMLAAVGLWLESIWNYDSIGYNWRQANQDEIRIAVVTRRGLLDFGVCGLKPSFYQSPFSKAERSPGAWWDHLRFDASPGPMSWWSPYWWSYESYSSYWDAGILAPIWLIVLVFAAIPLAWVYRRVVGTQRRALNHCMTCGYDLRATPDRCPECGMAVAPKPAEAAA